MNLRFHFPGSFGASVPRWSSPESLPFRCPSHAAAGGKGACPDREKIFRERFYKTNSNGGNEERNTFRYRSLKADDTYKNLLIFIRGEGVPINKRFGFSGKKELFNQGLRYSSGRQFGNFIDESAESLDQIRRLAFIIFMQLLSRALKNRNAPDPATGQLDDNSHTGLKTFIIAVDQHFHYVDFPPFEKLPYWFQDPRFFLLTKYSSHEQDS